MATLEELEQAIRITKKRMDAEKDPKAWKELHGTATRLAQEYRNQNKPGVVEDMVKGAGSGLIQGGAALLGLPGTVQNLMDDGMNAGMNALTKAILGREGKWGERPPLPEDATKLEKLLYGDGTSPLDMGSMQKLASNLTGGFADYEPETLPGKATQTVSSFLPGAAASAPAAGMKLAPALLKYGVIPGLASEAAGQVTEGTTAEPIARTAAAILSPGLASKKWLGPKAPKLNRNADELQQLGYDQVKNFKQAKIPYDSAKFNRAIDRGLRNAADQAELTPEFATEGWKRALSKKVDPLDRPTTDSMRIGNIVDEIGQFTAPNKQTGKNKIAAYHVKKELSDFAADPSNTYRGTTAGRDWPGPDLKAGKKNIHQARKANEASTKIDADTSVSMRLKAKNFYNKVKDPKYGWTKDELKKLKKVADGKATWHILPLVKGGEFLRWVQGGLLRGPLRIASSGLTAIPGGIAHSVTKHRANALIDQLLKNSPAGKAPSNVAAQPAPWAQYRIPQKEIEKMMLQNPALKDALLRAIIYGSPETRQ